MFIKNAIIALRRPYMKLKINKPRSEDDQIIATSLRLNKGVWERLQAESDKTRDSN